MRDDTNTKFLLLRVQTAYVYDLENERWLFGDMIDHVGIYESRVAKGLSASNVGLVSVSSTNKIMICTLYLSISYAFLFWKTPSIYDLIIKISW